jgi:glycosyltransferase involved in cell wall biosynthesis
MPKLKVAWICHFSNQHIRKRLPLSDRRLSNFLRKLIGKQYINYSDFAPWITNQICEFEKLDNIELHVIAPHSGLNKFIFEFEMNGVYYHFFKPDLFFLVDKFIDKITKKRRIEYKLNRLFVRKILKKIQPDIVNLIGTENPYYSITTIDIKDIPLYVSAQTVYTNPDREKFSGIVDQSIWDTELKIHQKEKYYGCVGRMHRDLILNNNPEAIIFKYLFPIQKPLTIETELEREFDFVFFAAQVTNKKGIEDALEAIAIVKRHHNNVSLNVVGKCTQDYKELLLGKIQNLNIIDNVFFTDYFPLHEDMQKHISKARFALLPLKLDVISSALIEAIYLELPIISYKTSGTPYLNKNGETVLLAEIGDIEKLAVNMLRLLSSPELASQLKKDAKAFVEKEFNNTTSSKRLVSNYKAVIDHYHNNIPIPNDLLFSTEEFPKY